MIWELQVWRRQMVQTLYAAPLGATSGSNTGINNVRMRFADVLLMYAEAVNELYGPRDDAQEALKRVRRRAFDSSLHAEKVDAYVAALTNEQDFFQAIMDERSGSLVVKESVSTTLPVGINTVRLFTIFTTR